MRQIFEDIGPLVNFVLYEDEAYVEYETPEEAKDAIHKLDRYSYLGKKLLVEWAHIEKPRGPPRDRDFRGGRRFNDIRCYNCGNEGHIQRNCPIRRDIGRFGGRESRGYGREYDRYNDRD